MDPLKEIIECKKQIQSLEGELSSVINTLSKAVKTLAERNALIMSMQRDANIIARDQAITMLRNAAPQNVLVVKLAERDAEIKIYEKVFLRIDAILQKHTK